MTQEMERRFAEVVTRVRSYHPDFDAALFERAFRYAWSKHATQFRKSGDPYIAHPLEVSAIVADMHLDVHSLCAAMLHDVVEDTDAPIEEVRDLFGEKVAVLVNGLTKIAKLKFRSREEAQAENIRKLLVAMAADIRVVLIKLADRLHNIRTLEHMPESGQQRIAQETLDIYAPIASRLGINWMKIELEDGSFRYLHKQAYYDLAQLVNRTRKERERSAHETTEMLRELARSRGLKAEVQGRPKHFYSIWRKLESKDLTFDQIHDLMAFRIIVDDVGACYEALGLVHARWKPVAGRFKDYIALPKANGYQSLHTTVVDHHGERIEIQIRSVEMHRIAEHGVAAHWAYKEGRDAGSEANEFTWLKQLMQSQAEIDNAPEFLEAVKLHLFDDEVFVFTPSGDIVSLPRGATPLDFAYAIHSEVGHHCHLAKVNGRVASLRYELHNGDSVEILTRQDQQPREEWVDIVKSSRAKSKIRQFIRAERRERAKELGRTMLTAECKRFGLRFDTLVRKGELDAAANALGYQGVEPLLLALGYGSVQKDTILQKILPPEARPVDSEPQNPVKRFGEKIKSLISRPENAVIRLAGMEGEIDVRYGKCCSPVPGEPVIGFVSRGRGVVVHAATCSRIDHLDEERQVEVEWRELGAKDDRRPLRRVTVRVISRDEPGLLSEMSRAFTSRGVNISAAHCRARDDGRATNLFDVMVYDIGHLNEALREVKKVDGVLHAERVQA